MRGRRSRARLLLIASAALAAALAPARAKAQDAQTPARAPAPSGVARKIDEFGEARGCDHGARLDNFAIELMNDADASGYVIAYGPGGEGSGSGASRLGLTKEYLVGSRGIEPDRVKTVYGGPYKDRAVTFVEFWLVPFGAEPPTPAKYENDAGTFKGKFAEFRAWDDLNTGDEMGLSTGAMMLAGYAEVLRSQPEAVGYVAAYNGKDAAPGAWRRVSGGLAETLEKDYGVGAGRVKTLFAGYSDETKIQLWVAAADAPPPVKERKRERRLEKAAQLGSFDESILRDEENARYAFKGLADVLKADGQLTACVVIHNEQPSPRDEDPSFPVDPDEPPPLDLVRLAEEWKARLKREYGVEEHRLVVMVGPPAAEWAPGELQTWVVPPGAPLPDPSAAADYTDAEKEGGEREELKPSRSL